MRRSGSFTARVQKGIIQSFSAACADGQIKVTETCGFDGGPPPCVLWPWVSINGGDYVRGDVLPAAFPTIGDGETFVDCGPTDVATVYVELRSPSGELLARSDVVTATHPPIPPSVDFFQSITNDLDRNTVQWAGTDVEGRVTGITLERLAPNAGVVGSGYAITDSVEDFGYGELEGQPYRLTVQWDAGADLVYDCITGP